LDQALFWTTAELEIKLRDFQHYFNGFRALGWEADCQKRGYWNGITAKLRFISMAEAL